MGLIMGGTISMMGADGSPPVDPALDRAVIFDEVASFSAEQLEAAASRPMQRAYTFDDVTLSIDGREFPMANLSMSDPEIEIRRDFGGPDGWSGTFTTTMQRPVKPWAESTERAMARALDFPGLLPEGPQRDAEIRRARRRERNRQTALRGGMIPHLPWRVRVIADPGWFAERMVPLHP